MAIPLTAQSHSTWIEMIGHASLLFIFGYALTYFAFPEAGNWAWKFLLLTSIAYCITSNSKKTLQIPILLWVAAVVVQSLSWAFSHLHNPEIAESSLKIHRLSHCFSFILIAWTLKEYRNSWNYFWLIAALGITITVWTQGDGWPEINHGLQGKRTELGFSNAQHTALVFGTLFIGLLIFSRLWLQFDKIPVVARWLLLGAALIATFTATMIAQSRGIQLGLGVAFVAVMTVLMFNMLTARRCAITRSGPIVAIAIVFCVLMFFSLNTLTDRWQNDLPTIQALAEGEESNLAMDSVGIRVTSWLEALEWIEQKPILGWGGNAKKHVIQQSESFPPTLKAKFRHLHNSYIELMVNYGLLGLLVVLALYYWIFSTCRTAFKKRLIPVETYYFCIAFLAYWITVNQFESFMFYSSGRFVFTAVISGIIGLIWYQYKITDAAQPPARMSDAND